MCVWRSKYDCSFKDYKTDAIVHWDGVTTMFAALLRFLISSRCTSVVACFVSAASFSQNQPILFLDGIHPIKQVHVQLLAFISTTSEIYSYLKCLEALYKITLKRNAVEVQKPSCMECHKRLAVHKLSLFHETIYHFV